MAILARKPPKVVLEIGTYRGGSMACWSSVAAEDALLIGVDSGFGVGWDKSTQSDTFHDFVPIGGRSQDDETLERVKNVLGDRQVDFLFIDGDHAEASVDLDFEMYSKLLAPQAIVGFHDVYASEIAMRKNSKAGVVWNRLRQGQDTLTLLAGREWGGIGLMFMP